MTSVNEISPSIAANLALNVYSVNNGDKLALITFMSAKIFSQKDSRSLLTGEVGGRVFRATKDGFGLCARGSGIYKEDMFLIFRGTTEANNKADFVTDARIGLGRSKTGLPVHVGFNHTFNSMLEDIQKYITDEKIPGTVHCIGHSLGGSVASLAADWISQKLEKSVKLYTFGAPRVGTEWFVKRTTASIGHLNMHRVYHRTDPVPLVALYPFMQAPYAQTGHFIYSSYPLTSGDAHMMANYVKSVTRKSWLELSEIPDHPYTLESALETWLKSKSPVDPSSASFWRWIDAALIYVIKKVAMSAIISLQGAFISMFTIADKIAYILAEGINVADSVSVWVEHLMRKLMQALNMTVPSNKKELTKQLIKQVLVRIKDKAAKDASNALKKL